MTTIVIVVKVLLIYISLYVRSTVSCIVYSSKCANICVHIFEYIYIFASNSFLYDIYIYIYISPEDAASKSSGVKSS